MLFYSYPLKLSIYQVISRRVGKDNCIIYICEFSPFILFYVPLFLLTESLLMGYHLISHDCKSLIFQSILAIVRTLREDQPLKTV